MNVVITGANRSLGLGFVRHYLGAGCQVWACFRNANNQLKALNHRRLRLVQWDVTQACSPAGESFPVQIDLLINNAGIY
ncbi:MAG: SDR family NAD(P)-dependent oxidoreductase [Mariprofundaceae bacterium]